MELVWRVSPAVGVVIAMQQSNDKPAWRLPAIAGLILALAASAAGVEVVRGPYLQSLHSAGVTICARVREPAPLIVTIWRGDELMRQISSRSALDHTFTVDGLVPDTTYQYCLQFGDARREYVNFRTAPAKGAAARIWVMGDGGTSLVDARAVRDAYERRKLDPTLILMLGNNAYPDGTDAQFQQSVFDHFAPRLAETPFYSTRGNHARHADVYYQIHVNPKSGEAGGVASESEAYYSADHGPVHLVCLDSSGTRLETDGKMMAWLRRDLAAAQSPWVIAFCHHPPYSGGSHGSDNCADSGGRLCQLRERFIPVLEEFGVDLMLTGHSHAYERTGLIHGHYGPSRTFAPELHVVGEGAPGKNGVRYRKAPGRAAGTVYVVVGSSGKLIPIGKPHPAMAVSISDMGSMHLDVSATKLTGSFVDKKGRVRDTFSITKAAVRQ